MTNQANIGILKGFFPKDQYSTISSLMSGEDGLFFQSKLIELLSITANIPTDYATDGMGDKAPVALHYFKGGADVYIIELESKGKSDGISFGFVDLGYGGELGSVSIHEITKAGMELDLHWDPKTTLAEVRQKHTY